MKTQSDIQHENLRMLLHLRNIAGEKEDCEVSLRKFIKAAWPSIEPGVPYVHGRHIDAMCDHFEAVIAGEIKRLIINLPPRSSKSTIGCVMLPAYVWITQPSKKFLFASYDLPLSMRDSRKCNMLIKSGWYQRNWSDRFKILANKGGQDTKRRFDNDKAGHRIATSTDAGTVGEGGDIIYYDDPNDIMQMQFDAYIEKVIYFHDNIMASRLNDPKTGARICVQQRSHERDMTGHILSKELGWEHLVLQMEYEKPQKTSIWMDWRSTPGELMWPERIGPNELTDFKKSQLVWCTPGFTPILMADWSEKQIQDIHVGDEIIGFIPGNTDGNHKHKAILQPAVVNEVHRGLGVVYKMKLESGREIHCTADHKWYRRKKDQAHKLYAPAKLGSRLHSVYQPLPTTVGHEDQRKYDWLGGILDGEGSCPWRGPITISQSSANPEVQDAITDTLFQLGFDAKLWRGERRPGIDNPNWSERGHWHINGGRSAKIRLLNLCKMAKTERIRKSLWDSSARLTESLKTKASHKVVSIECVGEMPVFGLTTTTGNYVAWGFASQNSGQYQQRPAPAEGNKFKRTWWEYWNKEGTTSTVRVVTPGQQPVEKTPEVLPKSFEQVIHSWDMAFKGLDHSDYVVGQVWGRIGAKFYLIHQVRAKLDFPATLKAFRQLQIDHPAIEKLVEDKANGPAVVATLRGQIPGIIAITPDGGKEARANAISNYVEAGNVYLPNPDVHSWVKEYIEEFASFPNARHDDSVDATSQALLRLGESISFTSVPEFRIMPRDGEKENAQHVEPDAQIRAALQPHWRRWISVSPGPIGAALWFCETPSHALRIYRELPLLGLDAFEVGRRITEATLPDIKAFLGTVGGSATWHIDVLLEKIAFAPIEPIGSYAELMEQGLFGFDPNTGSWDDREVEKKQLQMAKFSAQQADIEDAAFDRLRDLLRFEPPDYEELPYSRAKAFELAGKDINLYTSYMAAVEGRIVGEWPKIKFAESCNNTIAALGNVRRTEDIADPFMRALLIGVSAPPSVMTKTTKIRETPWSAHTFRPGALQGMARRRAS